MRFHGGMAQMPDSPAEAAAHLQGLLDQGRVAEAAHLVGQFGLCDWPVRGDQDSSVSAVVLERYADGLAGHDQAAARAAYLRAAGAQRSFAAFASAGGEGIARMLEADRLDAKAQSLPLIGRDAEPTVLVTNEDIEGAFEAEDVDRHSN
jgi:hypothetical protein